MTGKMNDKISYAIQIYIVYSEHVLFVTFFHRGIDWLWMHDSKIFSHEILNHCLKRYTLNSFFLFRFVNKILIFDLFISIFKTYYIFNKSHKEKISLLFFNIFKIDLIIFLYINIKLLYFEICQKFYHNFILILIEYK